MSKYSRPYLDKIEHEIVTRAWKDPNFKEKLLKDPKGVLKEMGVEIPADIVINIVEDKSHTHTFVLPPSPTEVTEMLELSAEEMKKMAAAGSGQPPYCD
jgi:hypothetical protein